MTSTQARSEVVKSDPEEQYKAAVIFTSITDQSVVSAYDI